MKQQTIIQRMRYHKKRAEYYEGLITKEDTPTQKMRDITDYEIQKCNYIAMRYWFSYEDLLIWRHREKTKAKSQIAHYFKWKNYSLDRIAMILLYRSHASVHYLLKTYKNDSFVSQ